MPKELGSAAWVELVWDSLSEKSEGQVGNKKSYLYNWCWRICLWCENILMSNLKKEIAWDLFSGLLMCIFYPMN